MTDTSNDHTVPVLPLRDVVVYPHMAIPLFVGREKSVHALNAAMADDKKILLVAQKTPDTDDPGLDEVYRIGTLATILQLLKLPDGTRKVLVEGTERVELSSFEARDDYVVAGYSDIQTDADDGREIDALMRSALGLFEQYVKLNKKVPAELLPSLSSMDDAGRLGDTIAAHLNLKLEDKQLVLETLGAGERLEKLVALIEGEIDILKIEKKIRGRVKQQMERSQRDYYLNEQLKAIQKELGENEDGESDMDELGEKIAKSGMPKDVRKKADTEYNKLKMMAPMSAEATVIRNYLDWLTGAPWKKRTKSRINLALAEEQLDEYHYGLDSVKERIVEYLAVQTRVKKLRGPILCLVGPPGVGKTSLGQSIAKATNRKFVRMSLGGVRDEAEIRGHRRTYIGSMPGKIVQNLNKVGVRNPLFLLDEIDKMANDFRGDPASALLEVLDPEQNNTFADHYLEVDFDLSDVMFVATANTLSMPAPLMDRMEIIRLPGYTEDEKTEIAQTHLLPKVMKDNGLKAKELDVSEAAIRDIVRRYTREAGVRNLERHLSKISRKVVKQLVEDKERTHVQVSIRNLSSYLGVPKFRFGEADSQNRIGQVTGLAWTEVGGELLTIEASAVAGKGGLIHTGSLGDVMKESVQAALTVVRTRAQACGISPEFRAKTDVHVHVPEGATPKDGPSAGIGMATALVSALTDIPVRATVAMTGEITLRGEVLPIGGLKEKLLAAHRGGIETVVIPEENVKDLADIPDTIKNKLDIQPVRWIDQVLDIALERAPVPLTDAEVAAIQSRAGKGAAQSDRPH